MEQESDVSVRTIIVTVFCIVAGLGAGYSLKSIVAHASGWQDLAYSVGAGLFIALSAVVLNYVLSSKDR